MIKQTSLRFLFVSFTIFFALTLLIGYEVGDWIELKATKPQGVPLHRESKSSMFGRALDGSKAKILGLADGGHWLKIELQDGRVGWIIERYVGNVISPPEEPPADITSNDNWLAWGSEDGCKGVIDQGRRATQQSNEIIRVGTWNIRWFPDETDLDWLSCTITWLNLDILAVQEFRDTNTARTSMQTLISKLNTATGGDWDCDLHKCGSRNSQHVGFLYNKNRLIVTGQKDLWQFNARATSTGSPCAGSLRPGRYCYVKSKQGGVDFHLISVHLKMGANSDAQDERVEVLENIDIATQALLTTDNDIIIVGDFNTMGDGTSGSAEREIENFEEICASESPGFIHLDIEPECTEYYRGHGGWLDHILVSGLMTEVTTHTAYVSGYCEIKSCTNITGTMPAAYSNLSDHCPVVFEINDRDDD